ncbi:UNVERIFIED_CONTAM: hypothetical protein RMT77_008236 [Armadillidium vulgare]
MSLSDSSEFSEKVHDLLGSSSGYGFSKHVDCNSALALIGLLLFLDLLRDLLEDVTVRRKRSINSIWSNDPPELITFVTDGGMEKFRETFGESLNHLKTEDKSLEQGFCEMNSDLTRRHGLAGRLFGTLVSNVIGRMKSSNEAEFDSLLLASRTGRTKKSCDTTNSPSFMT